LCDFNCSFVAGEPAGAFWTLAPAALAPPPWRAAAYAAALTFGTAVGLLRMAGGGHFPSDVVFAGFLTFLVIWLMHGLLYRWQATRTTDERLERPLERITGPLYDAVMRLAAHLGGLARRN
jgi:membrane-associated phospholipid phosphatase